MRRMMSGCSLICNRGSPSSTYKVDQMPIIRKIQHTRRLILRWGASQALVWNTSVSERDSIFFRVNPRKYVSCYVDAQINVYSKSKAVVKILVGLPVVSKTYAAMAG